MGACPLNRPTEIARIRGFFLAGRCADEFSTDAVRRIRPRIPRKRRKSAGSALVALVRIL